MAAVARAATRNNDEGWEMAGGWLEVTLTFTAASRSTGQLHAQFVRDNARPVSSSYSSDAARYRRRRQ